MNDWAGAILLAVVSIFLGVHIGHSWATHHYEKALKLVGIQLEFTNGGVEVSVSDQLRKSGHVWMRDK